MRAVRVGTLLLAGISALVASAFDSRLAEAEPLSAAPADTADYYTRRARAILKKEKAGLAKPHPLAAAYPGMDVVVCAAGCADSQGAHVVFAREHAAVTAEVQSVMVPTSASLSTDAVGSAGTICLGGCYDEQPTGYAPPPRARPPVERMDLPARDSLSPIR